MMNIAKTRNFLNQFAKLPNNIKEICIVSGLHHLGLLVSILGSGKKIGCSFTYKVQDEAGGIAEALSLCKEFSGNDNICVLLGDNIFGNILNFNLLPDFDACLFLKEVSDPHRFGVAEVDHLKKLIDIEEKPQNPKSNLAVTGAYIYSSFVWESINNINRSYRGELEISDVNKYIISKKNVLTEEIQGWWSDAGTQESYIRVNREIWDNLCPELNSIISFIIKNQ